MQLTGSLIGQINWSSDQRHRNYSFFKALSRGKADKADKATEANSSSVAVKNLTWR